MSLIFPKNLSTVPYWLSLKKKTVCISKRLSESACHFGYVLINRKIDLLFLTQRNVCLDRQSFRGCLTEIFVNKDTWKTGGVRVDETRRMCKDSIKFQRLYRYFFKCWYQLCTSIWDWNFLIFNTGTGTAQVALPVRYMCGTVLHSDGHPFRPFHPFR